jgi:hypothetical protein
MTIFDKLFSKNKKEANVVKEPYFSISCSNIDPVNGVEIEYECSDEFILYLRKSGYVGVDDETIIRNFFLKLYAEMHDKLKSNTPASYGDFE